MLNFKERNYYEQTFLVLDSEELWAQTKSEDEFIAQVYSEVGHLVTNTTNSLGIIVKNKKGIGLQNAKGKLVDEK